MFSRECSELTQGSWSARRRTEADYYGLTASTVLFPLLLGYASVKFNTSVKGSLGMASCWIVMVLVHISWVGNIQIHSFFPAFTYLVADTNQLDLSFKKLMPPS